MVQGRTAYRVLDLTDAERAALSTAQRAARHGSTFWQRCEIILRLDAVTTCEATAKRLRIHKRTVFAAKRLYLAGGRIPSALVAGKAGRPHGRALVVVPLLKQIRRDAARDLTTREYTDAMATRHGIKMQTSHVARYLRLGGIPRRPALEK